MENKKVSIPFYEGMKLNVTVDKGFLVAEYSEKEVENKPKEIEDLPIGSIFEYNGKYYLVQKRSECSNCSMCYKGTKCDLKAYKCIPHYRKDGELVVYKEIKDGDFIIRKYSTENWIVIFKSCRDTKSINYHAALFSNISLRSSSWCDSQDGFRFATKEEVQILLDAMHKNGKYWDGKKVVDYVEQVKVGNICILWDSNQSDAIIDKVVEISLDSSLPYITKSDGYENAIKCESIEQYKEFIKLKK